MGELKVIRKGSLPDSMQVNDELYLYNAAGIRDGFLIDASSIKTINLEKVQPLSGEILSVKLQGVNNRDDATLYHGKYIGIKLTDAKKRFGGTKEPYLFEYIDLPIFNSSQKQIGIVERIEESGPQLWLVYKNPDAEECMVPWVDNFVQDLMLEKQRLVFSNLEELGYE